MKKEFPQTVIGKVFCGLTIAIFVSGVTYGNWQIIEYDRARTEPFDMLVIFGCIVVSILVLFIGMRIEKKVIKNE